MLSAEQMRTLKKVNISNDPVKAKSRIAEDFKTTTNANKKMIVELSGLKRPTFYRVFETGAATARVVLSMSQVLGVSPYYYTGESSEKESFSNEVMIKFLEEHKYDKLVQQLNSTVLKKPKRQYSRKPKAEPDSLECVTQDAEIETESAESDMPVKENSSVDCSSCVSLNSSETQSFGVSLDNSPKMREAAQRLDEDSAALLLKALYKRAEAGDKAEKLCDLVKRCLLS